MKLMKMIQLYFDFVTLIELKSKMHVFAVKNISYILKCRLRMLLMLRGGAWRLMHQCTLQICTSKIRKPLSFTFVISCYKSPKKMGDPIHQPSCLFLYCWYLFFKIFDVFVISKYLFFLLQHCNIILCIRSSNKVTRGLQCYFDMEIKAKVQHKD